MIRIALCDYLAVNSIIPKHRQVIMTVRGSGITTSDCTVALETRSIGDNELTTRIVYGTTLSGERISTSVHNCQILLENSILHEDMSKKIA